MTTQPPNPQDQELEEILASIAGDIYDYTNSGESSRDEAVYSVTKLYKHRLNKLITRARIETAWHLHRNNSTKNKRDFDTDTDEYICQEYIPRLENLLKENKNE